MALTKGQVEILNAIYDLHLEGKKPSEITNAAIGQRIFKGKNTIKTQKTGIYKHFGIPDTLKDDDKMGVLIDLLEKNPPNTLPTEPEVARWKVPTWAIMVFILATIALSYLYFRPRNQSLPPQNTDISSATNQPILPTSTAPQATFTPVLPTFTLLPPTFTPVSPTFTLSPTETFTPEPTATQGTIVLFEDNFDGEGLAPGWERMDNGEVLTFGGQLSFVTDTTLAVGNSDWKNYEISFDLINIECTQVRMAYIGLRVLDSRNMMRLNFCVPSYWLTVENGSVKDYKDQTSMYNQKTDFIAIIRVEGNKYQFNDYPFFSTDKYPQGGVIIHFIQNMIIDNFKVVQLP